MESRVITVPDNGGVLVVTQPELSALRALLYSIDSIDLSRVMAPNQIEALYQLAREVRDI